jgi:hypothetical protein
VNMATHEGHNVRPITGRAGTTPRSTEKRLYRRPGPVHRLVMSPPFRLAQTDAHGAGT